jgi:hypothetical protein
MASRAPPRVADRNTGFKKWEVSREKRAVGCVLTVCSLILEYAEARGQREELMMESSRMQLLAVK